jgi:hypothetical protein
MIWQHGYLTDIYILDDAGHGDLEDVGLGGFSSQ